jgi:hypothetical protein
MMAMDGSITLAGEMRTAFGSYVEVRLALGRASVGD